MKIREKAREWKTLWNRLGILLAALSISLSVGKSVLVGQTDAVWAGGSGSWNDEANWLPTGIPNGTFNVFIDDGNAINSLVDTASSVTITVDSLSIDVGDVLRINNNNDFFVITDVGRPLSGMIINDGSLIVNNAGSLTDLLLPGDVSLTGSGILSLGGSTANSRIAGGGHLTNVGNVINGFGQLGLNSLQFSNSAGGIVNANVSGGSLTLDPPTIGFENRGLMTASAGGILFLGTGPFDNNTGFIRAQDGSTVSLGAFASITGGTLQTVGSGTVEVNTSVTAAIADLTNEGTLIQNNNSDFYITGIIDNQGEINVVNAANTTDVFIDTNTSLQGGGTITLGGTTDNSRILDPTNNDGVLTNVDNLIQGKGAIGVNNLMVVNQVGGVINANDASGSLTLDPPTTAGFENHGLLTASAGGTLFLAAGPIDNDTGFIRAQDGSTVSLGDSASITGGTLQTVGSGTVEVATSITAAITDLTNEGTLIQNNNADFYITGSIDNQGEINVVNAASTTDVFIDTNTSLQGGGTITLQGITDNSRILDPTANDGVLTNVDNLIQGRGAIGVNSLKVVNEIMGVIDANDMSGSLTLDPPSTGFENRGLLTASNGGTMVLGAGPYDNDAGLIRAQDGSTVVLINGATIVGGTVDTAGSGTVEVATSITAAITDLTNEGKLIQNNNADFYITGIIDNQGEINVVNAASTTDVFIDTNTSLQGGGTITLQGSTDNSRILDPNNNDGVLTNVDNLIQGKGAIGFNSLMVVNQVGGVIDANDMSGSLTLDPPSTGFENRGLLTASNGGTMVLGAGPYDNDAGLIRAQDGSTVVLINGATIVGGTVDTDGSGTVEILASNTAGMTDLTNEGTINQQNNADFLMVGTVANHGDINVNSTASTTDIVVDSPLMIAGPGSLNLTNVNSRIVGTSTLELLEGSLTGIGQVLVPSTFNMAKIAPGNSTGTLTFLNSVQLMNQAELEIEVQGTGAGQFDRINVTGTLNLGGNLRVDLSGFEPSETDTFVIASATTITGGFDNVPNGSRVLSVDSTSIFTVNYGPGSAYNSNQVVLSDYLPAQFAPTTLSIIRGIQTGGTVADLLESDNIDVSVQRNPLQTTGVVEVEVKSVSATETPTTFEFTLEAAGFFRSTVIQSIEFYDFDAGTYVEVDSRNTSRFNDSIAVASGTGNLSRFVEDGTGCVQTRILYTSISRRQAFSASIDQVFWFIQ